MTRHARTTFLGSVALAAFFVTAAAAFAADQSLPVKSPPPPPPPPSNWHAFIETNYNFGSVNPQGQAVYKNGDYNVAAGANLTLFHDKAGFINNWSIGGLGIVDFASSSTLGPSDSFWANNNPTQGGSGLYYILNANSAITFGQVWTLSDGFYHLAGINANGEINDTMNATPGPVLSGATPGIANCTWTANVPGANLGCLDLPAWYWNELKLSLNDGALTHWMISFNPYVTWWHNFYPSGQSGWLGTTPSASCFSCNLSGDDAIIGMTPTLKLQGLPVTITAPTWVTVGPKSFWNYNGATNTVNAGSSNSNLGVFTTGLTATWALTGIPAQYGHWNVKGGFQWYDIINNALIADNQVTWGNSFTEKSFVTGTVGLGVGF
jgi:hypothetical protein